MTTIKKKYDVLGIGNAIVDVVAPISDEFIAREGLTRGKMQLIGADRARYLYDSVLPYAETSGGSISNSCVGIASLGGKSAFIGKVADDQLGDIYARSLQSAGVHFATDRLSRETAATAMCLSLVTPDAERTMNTYLGAAQHLSVTDIDVDLIQQSKVIFLEGYSFDSPQSTRAFYYVTEMAQEFNTKVALSLSDKFCVERHRPHFLNMLERTDILFANEGEIKTLFETEDFEAAKERVKRKVPIACLTRGSKGSEIVTRGATIYVPVHPVRHVVDTTGAGDLYAGGFLYGYTQGIDLLACGRIGAIAASEAISHYGARPEIALSALVPKAYHLDLEKPAADSPDSTLRIA